MISHRVVWVVLIMFLTGCAGGGQSSLSGSPQNTDLESMSKQFEGDLVSSTLIAALVGGAVGCGIGAAATQSGAGCGIGAAAGAAAGAIVNIILQNMRQDQALQIENAANAATVLQQENQQLTEFITQAQSEIDDNQVAYVEFKKALDQNKLQREEFTIKVQQLNRTKITLQKTLVALKKRQQQVKEMADKVNSDEILNIEIAKYEQQIEGLKKTIAEIPDYNLIATG